MRLEIRVAGMTAAIVDGVEPGQSVPLELRLLADPAAPVSAPTAPADPASEACPCGSGLPFAECFPSHQAEELQAASLGPEAAEGPVLLMPGGQVFVPMSRAGFGPGAGHPEDEASLGGDR